MSDYFPTTVPVLEATDMCIGPAHSSGCGCLAWWCEKTFGSSLKWDVPEVSRALCATHRELDTGLSRKYCWSEPYATGVADVGVVTRAAASRVWNRAMAKLGYVVGNPECNRKGELKPV